MAKNVYLVMEFKAGNTLVGVESAWSSFKKATDYVNYMLRDCGDEYYYKSDPGDPDQVGKHYLTILEYDVNPLEHIGAVVNSRGFVIVTTMTIEKVIEIDVKSGDSPGRPVHVGELHHNNFCCKAINNQYNCLQ